MNKLLALAMLIGWAWVIYKVYKHTHKQSIKWSVNEFESFTVTEKIDNLNTVSNSLKAMEQLLTDIELADPKKNVRVLQIKWLGNDDRHHEESIYLDGINTESEIMQELIEYRITQTRNEIAEKSALLFAETGAAYSA